MKTKNVDTDAIYMKVRDANVIHIFWVHNWASVEEQQRAERSERMKCAKESIYTRGPDRSWEGLYIVNGVRDTIGWSSDNSLVDLISDMHRYYPESEISIRYGE